MARSRLYRTPAVILKRMDLGEADRIVTLFSRDGRDLPLPRMSKAEVAQRILDEVVRLRSVLHSPERTAP